MTTRQSMVPTQSRTAAAVAVCLGILATAGSVVAAPITFSSGTYSQNFDSMTGGTSAVVTYTGTTSTMLDISTLAMSGTQSSVAGWYIYATTMKGGVSNGSSNTGSFYQLVNSATTANITQRALGSLAGSSVNHYFGAVFQNVSGSTIDNVAINYSAVMNRNPSTTVNQYPLSYLVSSTGVLAGSGSTAGTFANSAGSWNSTALGFTTPSSGTGAPGAQAAINPFFTISNPAGNLLNVNWANNSYLYIRWSDTDDSGSDAMAGVDDFSLSQIFTRSLVWDVAGSGTWNTTTPNWLVGGTGSAVTYSNGVDSATFDNTAGGTITLSGTLTPVLVTVSAASGTYAFAGSATDKISGSTGFTKSGAGTAVFTSANDFTGGTTITGGIVQTSADGQLGSGAISLNGGSLESTAGSQLSMANAISVGSAGGTVNSGSQDLTISGAAGMSGVLTKSGNGKLVIAGAITSNAGAGYNVEAGSLQLGASSTSTGVYKVSASGTLTGNLIVSSTQRLDINGGATLSGPGKLQLPTSGALISTTFGDTGGTISAEIALNSGSAAFTPGTWSSGTYNPASFVSTIGANGTGVSTANTLTVGVISGNSDVDISSSSSSGGGGGVTVLNGASTYTGNTTINTGSVSVAGTANIKLGVDNALPITTGVIVGTKSGIGVAVLDMNGKNQQVAYLARGQLADGVTKYLAITNLGSGTSTLTVSGSTTPDNAFAGLIRDGTSGGVIAFVKSGVNTQTLSGSSSYSGGTILNAGTLATGHVNAFGTGGITANGGTLDLGSLAVANGITNNGAAVTNAASYAGTQTIVGNVSLSGTVGGTTVVNGGVLNVGGNQTPGLLTASTLTMTSGTTAMAFTGDTIGFGYSSTVVSTALTYGGVLQLNFGKTYSPADFKLFDFASLTPLGSFSSIVTTGTGLGGDYNGLLFTNDNGVWTSGPAGNGQVLTFTQSNGILGIAVPEPSTYAISAIATAGLAGLMRWRKRQEM